MQMLVLIQRKQRSQQPVKNVYFYIHTSLTENAEQISKRVFLET